MHDQNDRFTSSYSPDDHATLLPMLLQRLRLEEGQSTETDEGDPMHLLAHTDWTVRARAVQRLGEQEKPGAVTALLQAIEDTDPSVRAAAVSALGKVDRSVPLEKIVRCLEDSDWHVREMAVQTLALHEDYSALSIALDDPDSQVRQAAMSALQPKQVGSMRRRRDRVPLAPIQILPKKFDHQRRGWLRSGWSVALVAAALLILVVLPGVRLFADQTFQFFRVQVFHTVQVTATAGPVQAFPRLQDLGDVQSTPFSVHTQLSKEQAAQMVSFPLLLPSTVPSDVTEKPEFELTDGGQTTFTFRAVLARTYLARNGMSQVHIPANLDGASFAIQVGASVTIHYGQKLSITETPSPLVRFGQSSLNALRDFLTRLPNVSPEASAFIGQFDGKSGAVPIPIMAQTAVKQITVHGQPGVALTEPQQSTLIWQADGIIYSMLAQKEDATNLLSVAESLH